MQKTARAAKSDAKIKSALEYMIDKYNTSTFTPWKSVEIVNRFRIGGAFPTVLKELGVIKTEHGSVKLTEKMLTLRPSTVRKHMNKYVNENYVSRRKQREETKVVKEKATSKGEYGYIINVIRASVREELKDLFARLSS